MPTNCGHTKSTYTISNTQEKGSLTGIARKGPSVFIFVDVFAAERESPRRGQRKKVKSELRQQPSGGKEGGAPLTHFFRRPPSGPRPTRVEVRALRGVIERGVGGPHAPHSQPRPGDGERAERLGSPSRSPGGRRNLPPARGPGLQGPLHRLGRGRCGPQRRGRGPRRGRSCKQPQRPGLASKSPASQAPPRAARTSSPPRGRPSRGPGDQRRVQSPPRRAPAALRAVPAAEKGEVRTYLSLLSTPSWIHLSTSPQSIMDPRCKAAVSCDRLPARAAGRRLQGPGAQQPCKPPGTLTPASADQKVPLS
ncbi:PREDICTED: putative uncharacterized protein ENSP00000383309 [Hipposideros armiger]|uniref:Uncharacterized protein n=1 Tax=Hipposideros armiger TaxID=186990 RepID=A0A8B7QY06_HIPAR|nr:PREDICTED: putative uncharacterized protein ENSP00000383309 [Hipposideros armiger]